jgi:hypothetical protein
MKAADRGFLGVNSTESGNWHDQRADLRVGWAQERNP